MTTQDERAFLAQVALGWFSTDKKGRVWRHRVFTGGRGNTGAKWLLRPRRAERSLSAKGGYLRIMFQDGDVRRRVAAHRIVWMLANRRMIPTGFEINHRNGRKSENPPENLELATRAANVRHAIHSLGKIHPKARGKLNAAKVLEIRRVYPLKGMTLRQLGEMHGVHWHTIQKIVTRATWRDLIG